MGTYTQALHEGGITQTSLGITQGILGLAEARSTAGLVTVHHDTPISTVTFPTE